MSSIAHELESTLQSLDPREASSLTKAVQDVLVRFRRAPVKPGSANGWPEGYFEATAGAFGGERFERPAQDEQAPREDW